MIIKNDNSRIKYLYHYTPVENVPKIIESGKITSKDKYMFFTDSYYKSITLFEDEMMSNNYYFDLNCKLKRRSYANPNDYRIIKIPYHNDGKFVNFIFEDVPKNSIYDVSKIHEGDLLFDSSKVEVLDINIQKETSFIFPLLTKLAFLFTIFISPIKSKADTWLDNPEYYDISWFDENEYDEAIKYILDSPEKVAGLSYIANNTDYTFEGKTIRIHGQVCNRRGCTLYMTNHDWVPLPSTFAGIFDCRAYRLPFELCGVHRLLFAYDNVEIPFVENNGLCNLYKNQIDDEIETNQCSQIVENKKAHYANIVSEHGTLSLAYNRFVSGVFNNFIIIPDRGFEVLDYSITPATLDSSISYTAAGFNTLDDDVIFSISYKKKIYEITINYDEELCSVSPSGKVEGYYDDTFEFTVSPIQDHELIGYSLNGNTIRVLEGNSFSVTNIDEDSVLNIIVSKTKYSLINDSANNNYSFTIDKDFSSISSIELCINETNCLSLSETDYFVDNQTIKLNNSFISKQEEKEYELVVTFANGEKGRVSFRIGDEKPIVNPATKRNVLFITIILIGLFGLALNMKKRVDSHE